MLLKNKTAIDCLKDSRDRWEDIYKKAPSRENRLIARGIINGLEEAIEEVVTTKKFLNHLNKIK